VSNKRVSEMTDAEIREMAGCSQVFALYGTNGEMLTARYEEDGVTLRAEFRGSKLSAAEVRRLASLLTKYAEQAETWMREAAAQTTPATYCRPRMNAERGPEAEAG
jgi:hypothetical protein